MPPFLHLGRATLALAVFLFNGTQFVAAQSRLPRKVSVVVGCEKYLDSHWDEEKGVLPFAIKVQPLPTAPFAYDDAFVLTNLLTEHGYEPRFSQKRDNSGVGRIKIDTHWFEGFHSPLIHSFLAPEDTVVVALSGQGIWLPVCTDAERNTSAERFFFCYPASRVDFIVNATRGLLPKIALQGRIAPNGLLLMDSDFISEHLLFHQIYARFGKECRAGTKLLLVDANREAVNAWGPEGKTRRAYPAPPAGVAAFFACTPSQKGHTDDALKHSVFYHFVLEGLRGAADASQDRRVTVNELVEYVTREVAAYVELKFQEKQTPVLLGRTKGDAVLVSLDDEPTPITELSDAPKPSLEPDAKFFGQKAGDEFSNNGLKMKFCWCPPGRYRMGGGPGQDRFYSPLDAQQVDVQLLGGFWMGKYEVTQGEWLRLIGNDLSKYHWNNNYQRKTPWKSDATVREGDDYPAFMDFEHAVAFCRKLTQQERSAGRLPSSWEYTLPTEAEWEYACRAGTTTPYSFGEYVDALGSYAWFEENCAKSGEPYPHPVGKKRPNAWGMHDMQGNLNEYCADLYTTRPRPGGVNPLVRQGVADRYKEDQLRHLINVDRGGAFDEHADQCRSAFRGVGGSNTGLRVAIVRRTKYE